MGTRPDRGRLLRPPGACRGSRQGRGHDRIEETASWITTHHEIGSERFTLTSVETYSWTSDSALPVRIDRDVLLTTTSAAASPSAVASGADAHPATRGRTGHFHETFERTGMTRGTGPVPWGMTTSPTNASHARSTKPWPQDGSGWNGPSLDAAVEHAESDVSDPGFAVWKLQHPNAQLVGAMVDTGSPQATWLLTFAEPEGDSLYVYTGGAQPGAAGWVIRPGARELPPSLRFHASDVREFTTLGAIVARWEKIEHVQPAGTPTMVIWGYGWLFDCGAVAISTTGDCALGGEPGPALALIAIGRLDLATERIVTSVALTTTFDTEAVDANAHDGTLEFAESYGWVAPSVLEELGVGSADEGSLVGPRSDLSRGEIALGLGFLTLLIGFLACMAPLARFAATSFYTRLRKPTLLANDVRDQLVRHIRADPGISPPALQQATGAGWSTVVYHLGVLEKNGLVVSIIDGRHKRFFPAGAYDHSTLKARAVLANPRTRDVFEMVRALGPLGRADVARELGVTPAGAYWHLKRLERAGYLARESAGGVVTYRAETSHAAVAPKLE